MIDTDLIRRMRDHLLQNGRPSMLPPTGFALEDLAPFELASLERVTPLAELLFLMMAVDGELDDRELDTIRGAVRTLTDGLLRGTTADRLVDRFRTALERDGVEERLSEVSGLLSADREDAEVGVMLAAAVALADGNVGADEASMFERVVSYLGVGKRRIDELLGPR